MIWEGYDNEGEDESFDDGRHKDPWIYENGRKAERMRICNWLRSHSIRVRNQGNANEAQWALHFAAMIYVLSEDKMIRELPRRFHLSRTEDVGGVSGVGIVAEGVQFANGSVVLTWLTHLTSVAVYHSVDVLERIHGHEGRTVVIWDDPAHEVAK